ncbi:hypothetical protein ACEZDB_26875 [Streptacidiphilus sp. N1-3]|uniref:Uncharacterized protein n=1 Tax=Streptacidiphilus alkalitolerans TaxID=3342712 RepID=A0ABV6X7K2_9ACTN
MADFSNRPDLDARALIVLATVAEDRLPDVQQLLDELDVGELGYVIGALAGLAVNNMVAPELEGAASMRMHLAEVLRGYALKAMADGTVE